MIEDQDEAEELESELREMCDNMLGNTDEREIEWIERRDEIIGLLEDWYYEEGWEEDEIDDWLDWIESE